MIRVLCLRWRLKGLAVNFVVLRPIEINTLRANCKLQSGIRKNAVRTRLPPWRRSGDRTRLRVNFPANRDFYREFGDFWPSGRSLEARNDFAAATFVRLPLFELTGQ